MKYAYIHIPKTGGFSVKDAVSKNPDCQVRVFDHGVVFSNIPKHLKQIVVLREPIDRFTSAFFYIVNNYIKTTYIKDPEHFVQELMRHTPEAMKILKPQKHFHHNNGKKIFTDWVFHPQTCWFDNPYYVLFIDRMQQGFDQIGIDIKLKVKNKSRKTDFDYSDSSLKYLSGVYAKDIEYYYHYRKQL